MDENVRPAFKVSVSVQELFVRRWRSLVCRGPRLRYVTPAHRGAASSHDGSQTGSDVFHSFWIFRGVKISTDGRLSLRTVCVRSCSTVTLQENKIQLVEKFRAWRDSRCFLLQEVWLCWSTRQSANEFLKELLRWREQVQPKEFQNICGLFWCFDCRRLKEQILPDCTAVHLLWVSVWLLLSTPELSPPLSFTTALLL